MLDDIPLITTPRENKGQETSVAAVTIDRRKLGMVCHPPSVHCTATIRGRNPKLVIC